MQPRKSGIATTEFWTALIAQVLPVLVTTGVIGPSDVSTLEGAATKVVTSVGAMLAGAWVIVSYIKGRVEVKTQ